ncbi:PPE family domain protein [Mycobacterium ulcerans str. Harvey]|uniref:PPE family domain protein n=1 Tax=Mycobacterium ulcerans str. Harvey TaxID=1299332 RepID=A0ABN0R8R4_MYCUL|nr:PPE family domain protein [Mycobacterium ulcerans str. Harvey]
MVNWYLPISQLFYNTVGLPYFAIGIGSSLITSERALGLIGPKPKPPPPVPAQRRPPPAPHPQPWAARGQSVPGWATRPPWASCRCRLPGRDRASTCPKRECGRPLASDIVNPPEASAPGSLLGGMPLAGGPAVPRPEPVPLRVPGHRDGTATVRGLTLSAPCHRYQLVVASAALAGAHR